MAPTKHTLLNTGALGTGIEVETTRNALQILLEALPTSADEAD
jgi:hypothetical protein